MTRMVIDMELGHVSFDPAFKAPDFSEPQTSAQRIAELKRLLAETDYVALSDYDKDKPDVIAQRAAWRAEIRELEA